jgi:hypothetical protein
MSTTPVTLDMSKAQPIGQPVTLDMSKAQPIPPDDSNTNSEGTYKMTGPAGTFNFSYGTVEGAKAGGYSLVGPDADRYQKDAAGAAPDSRNWLQKGVDAIDTVTPEQEQGHGAVVNALQKFGAGAIHGSAGVLVHPINALEGIGSAIAHPVDAATSLVKGAINDPATAAGNIVGGAVLGEAGGAVGELAGKVAPDVLGRAVLLGKTPADAYESALKPSTTLSQADRASIIQTGLQQAIPVSKGGLEKIGNLIDDYNQQIKNEIASDPTRPIDPQAVAVRADAAKARFSNQVNAQPDLNAISGSQQQFLDEQGAKPGTPGVAPKPTGLFDQYDKPIMSSGTPATPPTPAPPMNAIDAQSMKQGTYQVLKGKFGEQGSASVEAQKALARGLKEEIATQFPEISNLNAAESRLLDLQPVLERAVNRTANHQLIGIGTPIAGAATKAVTGSSGLGAAATVLKATLDNPMVKSRLAIAVSKGGNIPYSEAMGKVAAYSAALANATEPPTQ